MTEHRRRRRQSRRHNLHSAGANLSAQSFERDWQSFARDLYGQSIEQVQDYVLDTMAVQDVTNGLKIIQKSLLKGVKTPYDILKNQASNESLHLEIQYHMSAEEITHHILSPFLKDYTNITADVLQGGDKQKKSAITQIVCELVLDNPEVDINIYWGNGWTLDKVLIREKREEEFIKLIRRNDYLIINGPDEPSDYYVTYYNMVEQPNLSRAESLSKKTQLLYWQLYAEKGGDLFDCDIPSIFGRMSHWPGILWSNFFGIKCPLTTSKESVGDCVVCLTEIKQCGMRVEGIAWCQCKMHLRCAQHYVQNVKEGFDNKNKLEWRVPKCPGCQKTISRGFLYESMKILLDFTNIEQVKKALIRINDKIGEIYGRQAKNALHCEKQCGYYIIASSSTVVEKSSKCRICKKTRNFVNNETLAELELEKPEIKELLKNNFSISMCPQCKKLIEKVDGCNSMHCTNCGKGFRWNPNRNKKTEYIEGSHF